MSDILAVAILATLPPTIIAITGLVVAMRTRTVAERIKQQTNSLIEQLVKKALAEGHTAGVAAERAAASARGPGQPPGPTVP